MAIQDPDNEYMMRFRADVRNLEPRQVVHTHIMTGDAKALPPESYYSLREHVARSWGLHPNEVLMVGSGKLGFSIKPTQTYARFDQGRRSDFDVALVSSELFDNFWREVFRYDVDYDYWRKKEDFHSYLMRGWMRPDLLPSDEFALKKDWFEYFNAASTEATYGRRKINGGIYKSWDHLQAYQVVCVAKCKTLGGRR